MDRADRGRRSEGSDARPVDEPLAAVDVDGLRPYRPGTPASRIHWAALARGAGLLERRLRADGDTRPLVVLDARGTGPPEHLDAAVRAAASLTLELARQGGCRLLLPGERRAVSVEPDLVSWPGLHTRLALVEGGPETRAPVLRPGARVGPLFYVAAQSLERLPAALAGAGGAAFVLVLPTALGHRTTSAPSFEVAGCRGFAIRARSALAAVPRGMSTGAQVAVLDARGVRQSRRGQTAPGASGLGCGSSRSADWRSTARFGGERCSARRRSGGCSGWSRWRW